ncbi:Glutathione peroxidase [Reticulomyxa filosa]|uniref:Glutathione peroxidase n=1 Tax=Reticulomyxa filosa TaxID=46433 RepID=X6N136_RETFI|nr:Glutathione peroxidase [Reticulomyxa filosa]|eukprot:ETO19781.1 Glutathione peroxidase [Reticulomyxa filosa]
MKQIFGFMKFVIYLAMIFFCSFFLVKLVFIQLINSFKICFNFLYYNEKSALCEYDTVRIDALLKTVSSCAGNAKEKNTGNEPSFLFKKHFILIGKSTAFKQNVSFLFLSWDNVCNYVCFLWCKEFDQLNVWKKSVRRRKRMVRKKGLFWSLQAKDIDGNEFNFEQLKGHVSLVINVACKCGFTQSSYTKLEKLTQKYWDQGLRVLCFPSNQFLGQEPWDEKEIKEWIFDKWPNLKAQMFSKIDVNGESTHPVYLWLKNSFPVQSKHIVVNVLTSFWFSCFFIKFLQGDIVWNFSTKFLIGSDGRPLARFEKNQPWSDIEAKIEEALASVASKQSAQDANENTDS